MADLTSTVSEQGAGEGGGPPEPSISFPLGWLLDHATPPIKYRAFVDVARLHPDEAMENLPLASATAMMLSVTQSLDGTWGGKMLTLPKSAKTGLAGVGTITAFRRLLEYGWHRDSPPLAQARRVLFRLLAEDTDPHFAYELAAGPKNPEATARGRQVLREAAAAALAQAGYESDPRLRGAARRIIERMDVFLLSPLGIKPWTRIGNRHVLAEAAAPPSIFTLTMLAHMPIFRSEHYPEMERLYEYLSREKPTQEVVQIFGKDIVAQPHLVLGDLLHNKNVLDSDVGFALMWLETMARLGFLKRNESWLKLFNRFIDDRGRDGVWRPHKGSAPPTSTNPYVWPSFPLEENLDDEARWSDVTFRIGLIARLLGWRINIV